MQPRVRALRPHRKAHQKWLCRSAECRARLTLIRVPCGLIRMNVDRGRLGALRAACTRLRKLLNLLLRILTLSWLLLQWTSTKQGNLAWNGGPVLSVPGTRKTGWDGSLNQRCFIEKEQHHMNEPDPLSRIMQHHPVQRL
jgi:hypothetical protein